MKLFSRKAVAAVATTIALTTAGLSAPAFAQDSQEVETVDAGTTATETVTVAPEGSADFLGSSSSDKDEDSLSSNPKEIREWVAVFTAIIGALSTAFVFIDRLGR